MKMTQQQMKLMKIRKSQTKLTNAYIDSSTAFTYLGKQNVKFLDTRPLHKFYGERIPTALNGIDVLNFRNIYDQYGIDNVVQYYSQYFQQQLKIKESDYIITYEDSIQSNWGPQISYFLLNYLGYKNVSILDGGFNSWKNRNFQTESKINEQQKQQQLQQQILSPLYNSFDIKNQINQDFIVNKQQIQNNLKTNKKHIIDVREAYEFEQSRIPNSINIPLSQLFQEVNQVNYIKRPDNIQEIMFKQQKIEQEDEVIVYSNQGSRSAQFQAALQNSGFSRIQNYAGSLKEWQRE